MWASEFWAFAWDLFLTCVYFVLFNALVLVLSYYIFVRFYYYQLENCIIIRDKNREIQIGREVEKN